NPSPTQVLRHAPCITPPICETQLHMDLVLSGFGNDIIEVHKRLFVPLIRSEPKWMVARPISKVSHWLDIVWTTFTKSPNANYIDTVFRRNPDCFWHSLAIFIAVHDGDICTYKTKRLSAQNKTTTTLAHKLIADRISPG